MSQVVVAQRMWQRRDTAANWTSVNPVLAAGEIGVELGANPAAPQKFKIGNGVSVWTALEYGGSTNGSVWRNGAGEPSNAVGEDGDYYLRTTNGDVYQRVGGVYVIVGNIMGPGGEDGEDGTDGREVEMQVAGGFVQWRYVGDPSWANLIAISSMQGPAGDEGPQGPPGPSSSCFPTAAFDGGTGDILPGHFCDLYVPFGFDILEYTLLGDAAGSIQVDVRVASYATFPPDSGDSICGGNVPTLSASDKSQNAVLGGWTTAVPGGSTVRFIVLSCTGIKKANLVLRGERS